MQRRFYFFDKTNTKKVIFSYLLYQKNKIWIGNVFPFI